MTAYQTGKGQVGAHLTPAALKATLAVVATHGVHSLKIPCEGRVNTFRKKVGNFEKEKMESHPAENWLAAHVTAPLLIEAHVVEDLATILLHPVLPIKGIDGLMAVSTPFQQKKKNKK